MIAPSTTFNGFCWIGDPHIDSKHISKRHDHISSTQTTFDKLRQCVAIANRENLYPLIGGDLFNRDKENHVRTINETITILKSFHQRPITVIGNHEKTQETLSEDNILYGLADAGVIDLIENDKLSVRLSVHDKVLHEDFVVYVGGTNYGQKIPDAVKRPKDADLLVWLTHHDLMFKQFYPGCIELKEIDGVDLVINGHMHKTQPQQQRNTTTWCNPGNILRQSIDTEKHIPSLWVWTMANHQNEYRKLVQHPLEHLENIFKQTPVIHADKQFEVETDGKLNAVEKLGFVQMMQKIQEGDNNITSDKDIVRQHMDSLFDIKDVPENVRDDLMKMLDELGDD